MTLLKSQRNKVHQLNSLLDFLKRRCALESPLTNAERRDYTVIYTRIRQVAPLAYFFPKKLMFLTVGQITDKCNPLSS